MSRPRRRLTCRECGSGECDLTTQVLIVSLAAVVIVAVIALAKWRIRVDEIAGEELRARESARAGRERRAAAAEEAAVRLPGPSGPADGAQIGVHIGAQLVKGTRVMRNAPEAEGWIVLEDAELLEGVRATPLGGRQWVPAGNWMQEL